MGYTKDQWSSKRKDIEELIQTNIAHINWDMLVQTFGEGINRSEYQDITKIISWDPEEKISDLITQISSNQYYDKVMFIQEGKLYHFPNMMKRIDKNAEAIILRRLYKTSLWIVEVYEPK